MLSLPRVEEVIKSILINVKNLLSDACEWASHYEKLSSSEEILNNLEEIQTIIGKLFAEFSPKIEEEEKPPEIVTPQLQQPELQQQQPLQQATEEISETAKVKFPTLEAQLESKIVPPFDAVLNVLKPGARGDDVAETLEKIKMDLGEMIGGVHPVFFKMTKVIAKIRRKRALTQEDINDLKRLAYEWSIQSGLTT